MIDKIQKSIQKFDLDLSQKIVLTEAATGDYKATAIIADLSGAKRVYALAKETKYGTIDDIKKGFEPYFQNYPKSKIKIITALDEIEEKVDIVTNSGFVRPINENILPYLHKKSVVTLMYEPWEFRKSDMNLDLLYKNGIKVYGTNEHDKKLLTMDYIGYIALYKILEWRVTPFSSSKIVVVGSEEFVEPIERILKQNSYDVQSITNYKEPFKRYDADIFIIAEHKEPLLVLGEKEAYINSQKLHKKQKVLHICGSVDFTNLKATALPKHPASFGYMSYRTDYIDSMALIDLQTGSLKVAEGMLKANELNLEPKEYKAFMEQNYPALAFSDAKYW